MIDDYRTVQPGWYRAVIAEVRRVNGSHGPRLALRLAIKRGEHLAGRTIAWTAVPWGEPREPRALAILDALRVPGQPRGYRKLPTANLSPLDLLDCTALVRAESATRVDPLTKNTRHVIEIAEWREEP